MTHSLLVIVDIPINTKRLFRMSLYLCKTDLVTTMVIKLMGISCFFDEIMVIYHPVSSPPFCGKSYNVRPPFDSVQLVNITPISLWFMADIKLYLMGRYNYTIHGV